MSRTNGSEVSGDALMRLFLEWSTASAGLPCGQVKFEYRQMIFEHSRGVHRAFHIWHYFRICTHNVLRE